MRARDLGLLSLLLFVSLFFLSLPIFGFVFLLWIGSLILTPVKWFIDRRKKQIEGAPEEQPAKEPIAAEATVEKPSVTPPSTERTTKSSFKAKYLGGHPGYQQTQNCVLHVQDEMMEVSLGRGESFRIPYDQIRQLEGRRVHKTWMIAVSVIWLLFFLVQTLYALDALSFREPIDPMYPFQGLFLLAFLFITSIGKRTLTVEYIEERLPTKVAFESLGGGDPINNAQTQIYKLYRKMKAAGEAPPSPQRERVVPEETREKPKKPPKDKEVRGGEPTELLRMRYAGGEISREEYLEMKKTLEES